MCRLFGFHSAVTSDVKRSLLLEPNALREQSLKHPDGWGVAWYTHGTPQLQRSTAQAHADERFTQVVSGVASRTVLAHIRRASVGRLVEENSHPFVHGAWAFMHNGTVTDFELVRDDLEARIDPELRTTITGDTDSERLFRLFLTFLGEHADTTDPTLPAAPVLDALERTLRFVFDLTREAELEPSLNLMVTNGRLLAACAHGRPLSFSTHKSRCQYRDDCPDLSPACERLPRDDEPVHHLVIASEHIGGPHVWSDLSERDAIAVGPDMRLVRRRFAELRGGLQRKIA